MQGSRNIHPGVSAKDDVWSDEKEAGGGQGIAQARVSGREATYLLFPELFLSVSI